MGHISSWLVEALSGDMTPEECDQTDGTAGSPDVTTRISYTGAHQVDRIVNIAQSTGDADATTTEVHDSLGRLHSVTEQSAASGAPTTTTYDYDLGDRLIAVATGSQSRAFTYDGRGVLISETHPETAGAGFSGASFRASQRWTALGLVSVLKSPARCPGSNCSMPG